MQYPIISEYLESIISAEDNFATLRNLRPVLDDKGHPIISSGNFSVVFKMKDIYTGKLYAVKCFTKEQDGRSDAYAVIARELSYLSSNYLLKVEYLEKELFVDTPKGGNSEFPVVVMDWKEGKNLYDYLLSIYYEPDDLSELAYRFSRFAKWLVSQEFAHGDIKPENILVDNDGQFTLVDYDGMYFPSMKGQNFRETGTPLYRHPSSSGAIYDRNIDDFALASINLSLYMIAANPDVLYDYFTGDVLLWKEIDILDISKSEVFKHIFSCSSNVEIARSIGIFMLTMANKNLNADYNLFTFSIPSKQYPGEEPWEWYAKNLSYNTIRQPYMDSDKLASCKFDEKWEENIDAIYSRDGKILKRFFYNPKVKTYVVKEGTEEIQDNAFSGFTDYNYGYYDNNLESLVLPTSLEKIQESSILHSPIQFLFVPYGTKSKFFNQLPNCSATIIELPRLFKISNSLNLSLYCSKTDVEEGVIDEFGVLYSKDFTRLLKATRPLTHYKIKDDTLIVCNGAFPYGIESVVITNNVLLIGDYSFFNCYPSDITYYGSNKRIIDMIDYLKMVNPKDRDFNKESKGPYYSSDGKSFLNYGDNHYLCKSYEIEQGTESICNEGFNDLFDEIDSFYFDELILPKSIRFIGKNVFNQGLERIVCKSSSFKILDNALYSADGKVLYRYFGKDESVFIPMEVEAIVGGAFSGYLNIKHVILSGNIRFIGDNPFAGISILNEGFHVSGNDIFDARDNVLYDNVNKILIAYWGKDEHLDIPDGIKYIGANAFAFSNIRSITVPKTIIGIDENAFMYALNLKKIDARTQSIDEANKLSLIFKNLHTWSYTFKNDGDDTSDDLPF
ncbi:MAG: leucine-rich repeat protein [Bacteroidaceae bacterium]|nr:leucine-rich repeat protein [Bacteroidaceae bacterium]